MFGGFVAAGLQGDAGDLMFLICEGQVERLGIGLLGQKEGPPTGAELF